MPRFATWVTLKLEASKTSMSELPSPPAIRSYDSFRTLKRGDSQGVSAGSMKERHFDFFLDVSRSSIELSEIFPSDPAMTKSLSFSAQLEAKYRA